jgi:sulfonate transport system ATP-binding protein
MSFIEILNLTKSYEEKDILSNINLNIEKGEFVSIIGRYGSGKTTLLKVIAGLNKNYTGEVLINGLNPSQVLKERGIGICFQKSNLLPWLNVIDNVSLPLKIIGDKSNEKAQALLKTIGLSAISKNKVNQLSGGMEKLVSIARSLILDPMVLLLDEPFSSLDEMSRENLYKKLLNIHKKTNKTTILITHSIFEAVYLSDKVIVLNGDPSTIKSVIKINLDEKRDYETMGKYIELLKSELDV